MCPSSSLSHKNAVHAEASQVIQTKFNQVCDIFGIYRLILTLLKSVLQLHAYNV